MAMRNIDCLYQRSLRSAPVERPKPLRRGQGVGGGNYGKQASVGDDGSYSRPSSAGRPRSASSVCSKSATSSSAASSSRPSAVAPKCKSSYRETRERPFREPAEGQYRENGPSTSADCQKSLSTVSASSRTSSTGHLPSNKTHVGIGLRGNRTTSSCPTTRNVVSSSGPKFEMRRKSGTPIKKSRICSKPSSSRPTSASSSVASERFSQGPGDSRALPSLTVSSPKPGPSCLRPPIPGAKKRVQFVGLSSANLGSAPDTRSKYKQLYRGNMRPVNGKGKVDAITCHSQTPLFGPSLYPIYPGQYETPLVSIPGPRQVLLMPGDINPNETTIIDVVGLNEGDIEEVPGIPPQAPASLLEDAWNKSVREAVEQDLQRRKAAGKLKGEKKALSDSRLGKNKEEQLCYLPSFSHYNFVHQGRAFSFEEHGNVRVDDPNNPPYEGPNFLAPDPQCQRARPFTYKSRKTSVRPYTDEERREMEEAETYRTIRAIICQHDAKWERDRVSRGLGDDDLMDVDTDECAPLREVETAPRDIFAHTDQCNFGEAYLPQSPEISPLSVIPQHEEDLIAWDETTFPPVGFQVGDTDLLTRTPPRPRKRRSSVTSPSLMNMCEPDVDLLGFGTPPRARIPTPSPKQNRDDLIRWETPQGSLPFDTYEETLFDAVTRTTPTASKLKTPLLRIVRAVPKKDDPNTAVLEGTPLAVRTSKAVGPCETSIEDFDDDDDSLGILNYDDPGTDTLEPWQQWNNFEEDFYRPSSSGERRRPKLDMSGIVPLDQFGEYEDLGILEEDCIPDYELCLEAEARLRAESKYQTMFQPLAQGNQRIEDEECPFEPGLEELERRFVEERADLLNLYHEPDVSPVQKKSLGRLEKELLEQCQDPIEQCADLLGLTRQTTRTTPPKSMGPFGRELVENCPEEQQLIDIDDQCLPEQPPPQTKFNYSKDLFTNVNWDPCMASKASENRNQKPS